MPGEILPLSLPERTEYGRYEIQEDYIPSELLTYAQWDCWRYVDRGEGRKPDKQPVNPRSLANAGVHWTNTWAPFEIAYATYK
jgi:primase-polymerase (primpol)-like protein